MAFRVEAKAFAAAAGWVGKRTPARPSIPIIAGVRLDVTGGLLTLTAFDHKVSASAEVEVTGDTAGSALVSGRLLAALAATFPDKPVDVEATGAQLRMRCGTITCTLPTMPVEDYPALPETPPVVGSVDGEQFAAAVARVAVAAGRDHTLAQFTGVHLAFGADQIELMATDRYRVARTLVDWSMDPSFDAAVLVPADVLADVANALAGAEVVNVSYSDGLAGFSGDGRSATSRLLDVEFPAAARDFILDDYPRRAIVDIPPLVAAVKRARLVAEDATPIRLTFTGGTVAVDATGRNDEATGEELDCEYTGSKVTVGMRSDYLLDVLGALPGKTADIGITTAIKPVSFADPNDRSYRHVVMPIRIGGNSD
jgi:DNA polymerase-3 subunit beta